MLATVTTHVVMLYTRSSAVAKRPRDA